MLARAVLVLVMLKLVTEDLMRMIMVDHSTIGRIVEVLAMSFSQ